VTPSPPPLALAQLPLFPLQTVLFPQGRLPLRVFEVRYLDLVRRCHAAGAPFGVVTLTQGQEVRSARAQATPDAFLPVGTLAVIEEMTSPQPGLIQVQCRGDRRFQVQQTHQLKHGLWVADVVLLPDDPAVAVTDDLRHAAHTLQQVWTALAAQAPASNAQGSPPQPMPIQAPHHWGEAGWVSNRWCELLPMPTELKQRLMALDNPLVRLELVSDILDKLKLGTTPP
jgi:uncharacterized protein